MTACPYRKCNPPRKSSPSFIASFLALVTLLSGFGTNIHAQVPESFNPAVNGRVQAIAVQRDGKVLIGGTFTAVGVHTRNNIARLNSNGTLDTNFAPTANGEVKSIAVQRDGKILVGGVFTQIGSRTRNRIARLNIDGTLDLSFDPNPNGVVRCIALQGDTIYLGGDFSTVHGNARNLIARLNSDGSLNSSFNASAVGSKISTIAVNKFDVFIGGRFQQIKGKVRNNIAKLNSLDSSLVTSFNPNPDGEVLTILQNDSDPYGSDDMWVGGDFAVIGGKAHGYLALIDDETGQSHTLIGSNYSPNYTVHSLVRQQNQKIIVGGYFSELGGQYRDGIARISESVWGPISAEVDTTFNAGNISGTVYCISPQSDGKILVGGSITHVEGYNRSNIALLSNDVNYSQVFAYGLGKIYWERHGSVPQLKQVIIERWNGSVWETLQNWVNKTGSEGSFGPGWLTNELDLSAAGKIRASGMVAGDKSYWFEEEVTLTPDLSLSGDLGFGSVAVGQSSTKVLTLRNDSNAPVYISNISFPTGFSGEPIGVPIRPGEFRDFRVTFSPKSTGNFGGNIVVESNAEGGNKTLPASGIGSNSSPTVPSEPGVGVPMRVQKLVGWGTYNHLGYTLEVVAGDLYPNGNFVPLPQNQQWQTLADDQTNNGFLQLEAYYLFGPYEFQAQYEAIYPWVDLIPAPDHGPNKNGHWRVVYLGAPSISNYEESILRFQIQKLQKAIRLAKKKDDRRRVIALNKKLARLRGG